MNSPVFLSLASVVLVSILPLLGVFILVLKSDLVQRILLSLVSFSTGALLGDVFLHLLPELAEDAEKFPRSLVIVLIGILASFTMEKIVHWRHCHLLPGDNDAHHHHDPHCHLGVMSLVGDAIHNTVDGIAIAAAFLVNPSVGFATTLAVILHEIPHEIGDTAVLLHSGYSKKRTIMLNLLTALTAIGGAGMVLLLGTSFGGESAFLAFAAGNLLYIAGSDFIPELHRETRIEHAVLHLFCMIAGIGVMGLLLFLE